MSAKHIKGCDSSKNDVNMQCYHIVLNISQINMWHWSISLLLIIYSCSLAVLGYAGWQLYFCFFIPLWLVSIILLSSVSGMILIAYVWFYYYWDYKDIFEEDFEENDLIPISETRLNTTSDFQLVSLTSRHCQSENHM